MARDNSTDITGLSSINPDETKTVEVPSNSLFKAVVEKLGKWDIQSDSMFILTEILLKDDAKFKYNWIIRLNIAGLVPKVTAAFSKVGGVDKNSLSIFAVRPGASDYTAKDVVVNNLVKYINLNVPLPENVSFVDSADDKGILELKFYEDFNN